MMRVKLALVALAAGAAARFAGLGLVDVGCVIASGLAAGFVAALLL